jgi:hypothetical protein
VRKWLAATTLMASCATASRQPLVHDKARADLDCPGEKIVVKETQKTSWSQLVNVFAACGCGKSAVYVFYPQANPSPPPELEEGERKCAL